MKTKEHRINAESTPTLDIHTSLLANQIEGIEGIVLQSGAYDLNLLYQETWWFRSLLNPTGERNPKLISILPEVSSGTLRPLYCTAERILWFPSNKRICCAILSRPLRNPTASCSIPIMGIACHWKTS